MSIIIDTERYETLYRHAFLAISHSPMANTNAANALFKQIFNNIFAQREQ